MSPTYAQFVPVQAVVTNLFRLWLLTHFYSDTHELRSYGLFVLDIAIATNQGGKGDTFFQIREM